MHSDQKQVQFLFLMWVNVKPIKEKQIMPNTTIRPGSDEILKPKATNFLAPSALCLYIERNPHFDYMKALLLMCVNLFERDEAQGKIQPLDRAQTQF